MSIRSAMSIRSFGLSYYSYQLYDVYFNSKTIKTLVTKTPSIVSTWISDIQRLHSGYPGNLIVGLDIQWGPNLDNPPATLQLCVDCNCIIIQLTHLGHWPQDLTSFLNNSHNTFVGVRVDGDKAKLARHFGVRLRNTMNLRDVAVRAGHEGLRCAGLRRMVEEVLRVNFDKPPEATLSDWEARFLSHDQIKYACLDAYASFEVCRCLI